MALRVGPWRHPVLAACAFLSVGKGATGLLVTAPPGGEKLVAETPTTSTSYFRTCHGNTSSAEYEAGFEDKTPLPPKRLANPENMDLKKLREMRIKLALFMIVRERVFNEKLWLAWIRSAKRDGLDFSLMIHTNVKPYSMWSFNKELQRYVVPERVQNHRCDVVEVVHLMLGKALADPQVSHVAMVSDNSVPIKSLRSIYALLYEDKRSRFCADETVDPPRAETWWLMDSIDAKHHYQNKDTDWFRRFLTSMHEQHTCVDETYWYWSVRKQHNMQKTCVMFTQWPQCLPVSWPHPFQAQEADFRHLMDAPRSRPSFDHPATFYNVSDLAFGDLLSSPFWFARKFQDGAISDDAIALADMAWGGR